METDHEAVINNNSVESTDVTITSETIDIKLI